MPRRKKYEPKKTDESKKTYGPKKTDGSKKTDEPKKTDGPNKTKYVLAWLHGMPCCVWPVEVVGDGVFCRCDNMM